VVAPSGCVAQIPGAKTSAVKPDGSDNTARAAQDVLERLMHAYQSGDPITIEPFVDPAMIGAQSLLDNIHDTQTQQKQIRIFLKNIQIVAGTGFVVIQANWEKRYLSLPAMTPKLVTGHASFTMSHTAAGWRLIGITGDNIFAAYAK
jgi:hypothetical protein